MFKIGKQVPQIIAVLIIFAVNMQLAGCTSSPAGNNPPPKDLTETPVSDFEYKYDAALQGVVITNYTGTSIRVRIPDKIEGEPVKGIERAFAYSGIMEVHIPNSVKSIGDDAFAGCRGLISITIPNSVTEIGTRAFDSCTELTSVTIPDSVTKIGEGAFAYCRGLTSVTIPNSVTEIGGFAFASCTGLTSITIPDSVTSIYDGWSGQPAFSDCKNLTVTYKGKSYNYGTFEEFYGTLHELYEIINGG